MDSIEINEKYILSPLKEIKSDSIENVLCSEVGLYICNFPDLNWHELYSVKPANNYSITKKRKFFSLLHKNSFWISPTQINGQNFKTFSNQIGPTFHLGSQYHNFRLQQIEFLLKIVLWFVKNYKEIRFILYYNFDLPIYFSAFLFKYIFRKKIIVDFEDDYTLIKRASYKNFVARKILYKTPDVVICINKNMTRYFKNIETYVFNGFIDLSYAELLDFNFKEDMVFLYGGKLDSIRGVDLLPDLVYSLRKILKKFKIVITGTGPLKEVISNLCLPEIDIRGFLPEEDYLRILHKSDAFLVLQKPDHPFNQGSYPSKIEYYAEFKKPIYRLELK